MMKITPTAIVVDDSSVDLELVAGLSRAATYPHTTIYNVALSTEVSL